MMTMETATSLFIWFAVIVCVLAGTGYYVWWIYNRRRG